MEEGDIEYFNLHCSDTIKSMLVQEITSSLQMRATRFGLYLQMINT